MLQQPCDSALRRVPACSRTRACNSRVLLQGAGRDSEPVLLAETQTQQHRAAAPCNKLGRVLLRSSGAPPPALAPLSSFVGEAVERRRVKQIHQNNVPMLRHICADCGKRIARAFCCENYFGRSARWHGVSLE